VLWIKDTLSEKAEKLCVRTVNAKITQMYVTFLVVQCTRMYSIWNTYFFNFSTGFLLMHVVFLLNTKLVLASTVRLCAFMSL
jgi:hypothetical protein